MPDLPSKSITWCYHMSLTSVTDFYWTVFSLITNLLVCQVSQSGTFMVPSVFNLICICDKWGIISCCYFLAILSVCCVFIGSIFYGVRTAPYWKYVWNEYLLKKAYTDLHCDWLLYIVHGFIGQSSILWVCGGHCHSMCLSHCDMNITCMICICMICSCNCVCRF